MSQETGTPVRHQLTSPLVPRRDSVSRAPLLYARSVDVLTPNAPASSTAVSPVSDKSAPGSDQGGPDSPVMLRSVPSSFATTSASLSLSIGRRKKLHQQKNSASASGGSVEGARRLGLLDPSNSSGGMRSIGSARDLGSALLENGLDRNSLRLPSTLSVSSAYGRRRSFIHQTAVGCGGLKFGGGMDGNVSSLTEQEWEC